MENWFHKQAILTAATNVNIYFIEVPLKPS
jgi:hypothetical protein